MRVKGEKNEKGLAGLSNITFAPLTLVSETEPWRSNSILWFTSSPTWEQYGNYLRFKGRKSNPLFLLPTLLLLYLLKGDSEELINAQEKGGCYGISWVSNQNLSCFEHISRLYYTVFFSVMCDRVARFSTIQLEKVRYAVFMESEHYFFFLCENWKLLEGLMWVEQVINPNPSPYT